MAFRHISEVLTPIIARMTDQQFVEYLKDSAADLKSCHKPKTAADIEEAARRIELWCGFKCICGSTESYQVCTECGDAFDD